MHNTVTAFLVLLYLINVIGFANGDTLCIKQDGSFNIEIDCLSDCKEQSCESFSPNPSELHIEHHDDHACLDLTVDNLMRIQRHDNQRVKVFYSPAFDMDCTIVDKSKTVFNKKLSVELSNSSAFLEFTFLIC